MPVFISGAVEGPSDEAVFRRIVNARGAEIHRIQVQNGKENLRRAVPGYNDAAKRAPWLVLVDLDQDFDCPPPLVQQWMPIPSRYMSFRVVVRQIESWLLADRDRFASFFSVTRDVPDDPDSLPDAKQALLEAIRRSRRKAVKEDMLPREGSGRRVGAGYTSRLIEFASDPAEGWRPDPAAKRSPSLASCLRRLDALIESCP